MLLQSDVLCYHINSWPTCFKAYTYFVFTISLVFILAFAYRFSHSFFSFLWFCYLYFNSLFVLIFTLYIPQDWTMIYLFRKHVFKLQVFFNLWKSVFLLPILYAWISYWQLRKLLYSFKCLASIYCVIVLAEIVSQSRHLKKEKINIIIARIFGHTWYSQLFFTRHHYD